MEMISLKTERLLALFFRDVGLIENKIEAIRESLCLIPNFSLFSVYRTIDSRSIRSLDELDFGRFLSFLGIAEWKPYMKRLIDQFDSDGDGQLSVEEFMQILLPAVNKTVRRLALSREFGGISAEIRHVLKRLFTLELEYHTTFLANLHTLVREPDFDVRAAFDSVSLPLSSNVSRRSLGLFLQKIGTLASDEMIDAIFRRLDCDGDEELDFQEFSRLFVQFLEEENPTKTQDQKTPIRNHPYQLTPTVYVQNMQNPVNSQKEILSVFFQNRLNSLHKLNSFRSRLRFSSDFDLYSAYLIFDPSSKGFLTIENLLTGLQTLGIRAQPTDLKMLLSYHTNSSLRLDYASFREMVFPGIKDTDRPEFRSEKRADSRKKLTPDFAELFAELISDAKRSEAVFSILDQETGHRLEGLFDALDADGDHQISVSDFLRDSGMRLTQEDTENALKSVSLQRDENLSYLRFMQYLTPRRV